MYITGVGPILPRSHNTSAPFGVDRYSPELENILFDYARICRVETVMKPYMEVLV